jgi:hypothetical protein
VLNSLGTFTVQYSKLCNLQYFRRLATSLDSTRLAVCTVFPARLTPNLLELAYLLQAQPVIQPSELNR